MTKKKIRYSCKCNRTDPEHTIEDAGDGWTRYVCSSCGKVKFMWSSGAAKDSKGK
jgi:predicted SprT family Zn-dependent metalloprotease